MAAVLRPALSLLLLSTLLLGLAYPALVTGLAQALFPAAANGSLIVDEGRPAGSSLIGQPFAAPGFFWGRPSATTAAPYDGAASAGSNLGPTNPALVAAVRARLATLRAADPGNPAPVPIDLVTASGSGLDPHISPAAADYQAARVARARGLSEAAVRRLVVEHVEGGSSIFGAPRVNVLRLNLALARGLAPGETEVVDQNLPRIHHLGAISGVACVPQVPQRMSYTPRDLRNLAPRIWHPSGDPGHPGFPSDPSEVDGESWLPSPR